MNDVHAAPTLCLNCDQPLGAPRPNFCPQCGQETMLRPPRLGDFVQQWGGAFVSTEGALWRTLRLLLLKPGELTRQYLAGRRRHYVLPLRLYLTTSVITLLLMRAVAQFADDPAVAVHIEMPKEVHTELGFGRAGLRDGRFFCENLPQWLCRRIERRLDVDPKWMRREAAQFGDRILGNLGVAMFVLLPSFAAFTWLVYRNRRLYYTEHLVFALHVHAFWFVAILPALSGLPWVDGFVGVAIPVYTLMAMKRVFGGRLWPRILRSTVVVMLYAMTLALALTGAAVFAFLT